MSSEFTICEVCEEAIPLIRELAWAIFPHTYRTMLSPEQIEYMMDMMYSERALRWQFAERGDRYFILRRGEDPVGYLSVRPDTTDCYHLEKLYTLPTVRGLGAGRLLFDYAKQVASEWAEGRACRLELNVNRDNPAVAFYYKMGMHEAGRGDFPIGEGYYMTDYIMAIDIPARL